MTLSEHLKKNLYLAIPVIISQVGQISVNLFDNLMVGRLGKQALGSISLGNAVFMGFFIFALGFSFALSPLVAEADANNKISKAQNYFKHSMALNVIIAIILCLIGILFSGYLYHFKQPKEVIPDAILYLNISLVSIIPAMIFQTYRQFSEGLSLTIPVTIATIIANLLNIGLNYLLIFGKYGFPRLEVAGSAYATLVSRIFMLVLLIIILFQWKKFKTYYSGLRFTNFKIKYFKRLYNLGIPTGLQMFFEVSAFAIAAFICGLAGTDHLAAHQITINLVSISFMICMGFAVTATVRIGNQLGLKDYKTLKEAGYSVIIMSIAFMVFCGILLIVGRYYLPSLYIDNKEVIDISATLMIIAALFQISDGIQVVTLGALRGLQDVLIPTLITMFAYYITTLPLGYYLTVTMGLKSIGMWIALGIGLTISAIMLLARFHYKTKSLIQKN